MKRFFIFAVIASVAVWYLWNNYTSADLLKWSDKNKDFSMAEAVDYYAGFYHFARNEYPKSLAAFDQLEANHPESRYLEEALYRKASMHDDMHQYALAQEEYGKFIEKYPDSPHINPAKKAYELIKNR